MSKFKVGDSITSMKDQCTDISIGNKYVVIKCEFSRVYFKDDGGCSRDRTASNYELSSSVKDKKTPPQFIVTYDETCGDPHQFFQTRKEIKAWIKEALTNKEIINNTIRIFPLGQELGFDNKVSLRKVK